MLSMPQSRKVIHKQDEVAAKLRKELRAAGIRSEKKRRELIGKAASSRPANLSSEAREAVRNRRVQRDLDMIAGRQG